MNSVMKFLNFTGESPHDYIDNRLPTLDCTLYVSDDQILHGFYEKPMRNDKCLDANTALSQNVIKSALRQEIIRRLLNMHLDTPLSEKIATLDLFYEKLIKSGHKPPAIRTLFIEALLKFKLMVSKSQKNPQDKNFKPLYLSNSYDQVNRGIKKYLRKFNWYDPELNDTDKSWMLELPRLSNGRKFRGFSKKNSVLEPPPLDCVVCS